MQLKVNNKYKRIGTDSGFETQPGEVVLITSVRTSSITFCIPLRNKYDLALTPIRFKKEFIPNKNPINFKGIL